MRSFFNISRTVYHISSEKAKCIICLSVNRFTLREAQFCDKSQNKDDRIRVVVALLTFPIKTFPELLRHHDMKQVQPFRTLILGIHHQRNIPPRNQIFFTKVDDIQNKHVEHRENQLKV